MESEKSRRKCPSSGQVPRHRDVAAEGRSWVLLRMPAAGGSSRPVRGWRLSSRPEVRMAYLRLVAGGGEKWRYDLREDQTGTADELECDGDLKALGSTPFARPLRPVGDVLGCCLRSQEVGDKARARGDLESPGVGVSQPLVRPLSLQLSSLTRAHQEALSSLTSKAEGLEKSLTGRAGDAKELAMAQREAELLREQLR